MKNYKQILEAINRGIKFALDDFEEQDELQGQVSSKVKHQQGTRAWLDLMKEVVDLGLPSGTLWCKYNLGCNTKKIELFFKLKQSIKTQNYGKYLKTINSKNFSLYTCPGELLYGDFYAWGELEPNKPEFSWDNYKFGKNYNKLTKYCNDPKYGLNGFTDNLTELLPEDDVAYLNKKLYNFKFHIPTKELFEELIKYTTYKAISNYKGIISLAGGVFTSKINGEEIFFPYTGWKNEDGEVNAELFGYYWSSTSNTENNGHACYLNTHKLDFDINSYGERNMGFKIRPVLNL